MMDLPVMRFGGFEANLRTRELWKQGVRVHLQDQPFQILAMMLERPGDIVTREEICGRLWPDGTNVDFEHSVNAAIKRLRAALGDTADSPRFVETLPRRGYRFIAPVVDSTRGTSAQAAGNALPRMVVLPFDDLSHERANDYFSDGLTEEMISQLGRLLGTRIRVIARTSSMLLKGTRQTVSDIGKAFGASYVMEGSVRRDGDRLRVTTQLIETAGETHLWAESYDRRLADVLSVQREVSEAIAQALMVELLPGAAAASAAEARNPDAYQAYLKGLFHWHKPGDAGLQASLRYFDQAIALDPAFAAAHAARARCYVSRAEYYREAPRTALETARAGAERALELNPREEDAHVVIAEVRRVLDWDTKGARAAYGLAFAMNPSSHAAHRYYAVFLAARGESEEAAATADRGCELDPFCLATSLSNALIRFFSRQYEDVIRRCGDILDKDQTYLPARRLLATALAQVGRYEDAVAQMRSLSRNHLDPVSAACLGYLLAKSGDRSGALAMRSRLAGTNRPEIAPAYWVALLHAALGDQDAALAELQTACEQRDPWLDTIAVDPRFEPLRADPRFRAIVNRLRVSEAA
jgi:TolB-like protein/Tfp pilus assembly protein PilF